MQDVSTRPREGLALDVLGSTVEPGLINFSALSYNTKQEQQYADDTLEKAIIDLMLTCAAAWTTGEGEKKFKLLIKRLTNVKLRGRSSKDIANLNTLLSYDGTTSVDMQKAFAELKQQPMWKALESSKSKLIMALLSKVVSWVSSALEDEHNVPILHKLLDAVQETSFDNVMKWYEIASSQSRIQRTTSKMFMSVHSDKVSRCGVDPPGRSATFRVHLWIS